ncbi:P-loop containing nucleoside triphosphate hydrolase protein [Dioscorea alata]|uniref:P-loop containing nucleoside triphosphate hydrolase protein n=1 Tax=Dioscorea alata TaxID=55571 RepID=A0ACB7UPS7_DIOAL|nr:P-loop containing nucleoside triphosphate hydrolase protein [Dioscorea alata]
MAVVSAFLRGLCQRLQATIAASDELPLGVDKELGRLLKAFVSIQVTTLEAAENKQSKSKVVQAWLCELKEAAYDADDLLDCLVLKAQEPEVEASGTDVVDQRRCLIFNCGQEHPVTQTELMIQDIRRRVQKLMRKKPFSLNFHHRPSRNYMSHYEVEARKTTSANSGEFGRDEDMEKMIKLLTSEESCVHEDLSLIAIVGRPGVGKTTLARIVYDEHRVASHFPLKMWVTASEVYDAGRLLRSIYESSVGFRVSHSSTMDYIVVTLKNTLAESRYLLILDDVRNEILNSELLREQLECAPSGSKIVITTENEEIAKKMRLPFLCYYLQGLSHGDSWSLFKECALLLDQGACQNSKEIEEVGLEIVTKLEGLPLAVRMVGHLLCFNFDLNDWKMILNADVWRYKSEELRGVPAAVWLSYQHLPPHIKQCFGYCSVFPRDHKFDKQSTVHMWMAQGLIQPQQGKQMEDLGNEYFDYLLKRSFFQNSSCRDESVENEPLRFSIVPYCVGVDYTRPKSLDISEGDYIMHGLIHDLALSITACESLRLSPVAKSMKENVRHFSVQSDKDTIASVLDIGMLHNLRTLLFDRRGSSSFDYDALFMNLRCIRVLCLSDIGLENLPDSIGNLKQLRCLDLTNTSVNTVPHVLCGLCNLQTLKLSISSSTLPPLHHRGMSNLINLRHLKVLNVDEMCKIGQLTSLQELEDFTVLDEDGHRIEELKNMTQLRGKLCISRLENVHTKDEAMEAKLHEKKLIEELVLKWSRDYTGDKRLVESHFATLEALRPHANLKTLIIWSNNGGKIPTWLEDGSLSSLETLEINECYDWDISLLGQLKSLKILRLDGLFGTQHVDMHNDRDVHQLFPCLRILDLINCRGFVEVPQTLVDMQLRLVDPPTLPRLHQSRSSTSSSSLASLRIINCPRLTTLQAGLLAHQSQIQLQALHYLIILHCRELVHLPDHGFSALVSLKTLHIENCPKLRHQPADDSGPTLPSSLIDFRVIKCAGLTSDSFFIGMGRLHSLSSMVIKGKPAFDEDCPPVHLPVFTTLPWGLLQHLKSLKELEIVDCSWLTTLGLQALVSLKRLKVAGCPRLAACSSPSDKSPMLLEYLEIKGSSLQILNGELLHSLINLQELKISECNQLVKFPNEMEEGLHCLVSLKRLSIDNCHILQSLPRELATIPSLEEVCVIDCDCIQSIPEKGLPASLFMLLINCCRSLEQRCLKDGEDWSKKSNANFHSINVPLTSLLPPPRSTIAAEL